MTDDRLAPAPATDDPAAVRSVPHGGGVAARADEAGSGDGDTGTGVVDDEVLGDPYALLAAALGDLASHVAALARSTDVVVDHRRREALARGLGQVARLCLHLQRLCELWHEADAEGAPPPPPEVEDDPGDLTCPRCDGPISLVELRERGHCGTCAAATSAVPGLPGEDDEPVPALPDAGEGDEEGEA